MYRVDVTGPALEDMEEAVEWIARESIEQAIAWELRAWEAIESLAELPQRCPLMTELLEMHPDIRQHCFGTGRHIYRVIFSIQDSSTIRVLRVYHSARSLSPEQLQAPKEN
jgi:plasmid stabilization system protein ParE